MMNFKKENGSVMEYSEIKAKSTPIAMVAPEMKQPDANREIKKTCAVLGCEDYKNFEPDSFFGFPEDPSQRQIWTDLTGRNNWTPTDYSYICINHFSVDSFICDAKNDVVLIDKAVPSLQLPGHVLEVEYIDESTFNSNSEYESDEDEEMYETHELNGTSTKHDNIELLKLFTEVQKMQRQAVGLKEKIRCNTKLHNQQNRHLARLKESVVLKQKLLNQKAKKKARILLSLQDKIKEDTTGLVLAMPHRQSDDLKNFALSIYRHSPQSYIYVRNTLRTMLPSTEVLDSWISSGYHPKSVLSNCNSVKVVAEQSANELSCKVSLH